jgi:hypothetical protein
MYSTAEPEQTDLGFTKSDVVASRTLASSLGTPTLHAALGAALSVLLAVLLIALAFAPATRFDEVMIALAVVVDLIGGFLLVRQVDDRRRLIHDWRRRALDRVTDYLVVARALARVPDEEKGAIEKEAVEQKVLEAELETVARDVLRFEDALSDASAYDEAATIAAARRDARLEALRMWDVAS